MSELNKENTYQHLIEQIAKAYEKGRQQANSAVNTHLVETYWTIGEYIVEFEQNGKERAEYGKGLINRLIKDLLISLGRGFSRSNISRMRQFYIAYPKCAELPHILTWTHWIELLKIEDSLERSFYEKQSVLEKWSTTELILKKKSSLYLRLAASRDKEGILKLAKEGQQIERAEDIIREPYILDFLKIPEPYQLTESELESRIISHLQQFLLELGKGFAFIGRQYRIVLGNRPHYVDLVFYHRILKCFVLIDLKREEAGYEDVGQMNMYLGYFENEENTEGDNAPIGIILAREKDDIVIQYALHNVSSQLFVKKYQLYLPNREELKALIERQLKE
ncbi:MAG: PDDEXK nuclease domain-containing protein [Bacteroidota bacterium]